MKLRHLKRMSIRLNHIEFAAGAVGAALIGVMLAITIITVIL